MSRSCPPSAPGAFEASGSAGSRSPADRGVRDSMVRAVTAGTCNNPSPERSDWGVSMNVMVGVAGFEPTTSSSRTKRATKGPTGTRARTTPHSCAPPSTPAWPWPWSWAAGASPCPQSARAPTAGISRRWPAAPSPPPAHWPGDPENPARGPADPVGAGSRVRAAVLSSSASCCSPAPPSRPLKESWRGDPGGECRRRD